MNQERDPIRRLDKAPSRSRREFLNQIGGWLVGDRFSLADIALAPRLDMFPLVEVDDLYERYPGIGALMERIKARPSWQASALLPEQGQATTRLRPAA